MRDYSDYLVPRRRATWQFLVAVLLLAGAVLLGVDTWHKWNEVEALRRRVATLAVPPPAPPKPSRAELDMQARWLALRSERDFRWYPVFAALEGASSEDIELLEFQPEKVTGQVTLRGEARSVEVLFDYVQSLSEQPAFASAVLLRQKRKQRGQPDGNRLRDPHNLGFNSSPKKIRFVNIGEIFHDRALAYFRPRN